MTKTELLAPARDYAGGKAAIDYGADALYVGGPVFGARQAAANTIEEISGLVDYARIFGVKVYVALNTIIFEHELPEAERVARQLISAGVDALIVQDMAFARMGLTGVELYASTQVSNTTPQGVRFLQECGFSRVILERGLTLEQIEKIREGTSIELESFVHGAICVCTSGKCYLSRSMGSRSGNRGECSQPCRLTYDLLDTNDSVLIRGKHLLSVKDLDFSAHMGTLLDAGVTSFKIEGRLKDERYVKNTVAHYRKALDGAMNRRDGYARASSGISVVDFVADTSRSFSRGSTDYFLLGKKKGVATFDTPKSAGHFVGVVTDIGPSWFALDRESDIVAGDGITFFCGTKMSGTNINRVEGGRIFPNEITGIKPGVEIRRNNDHLFNQAIDKSRTTRKIEVQGQVEVSQLGVIFTVIDSDGFTASARLDGQYDVASDSLGMETTLRRQLSKSGETVFRLTELELSCQGQMPFIPVSALNGLRREALAGLISVRISSRMEPVWRSENKDYPYPRKSLEGDANVVNSLSEQFYRDHGVVDIEPGHDLLHSLKGMQVMTTPYCLRLEAGLCPKVDKKHDGSNLYLHRGAKRYRLDFDCAECIMTITEE